MPKVDMDQEKATIISWEKQEGASVKQDETVLIVETEKVAIDVTSPATGILAGVKYKVGDVVPVATVIAYILKAGETAADLPQSGADQVKSAPAALSAAPAAVPAPAVVSASPLAARMASEMGIDISKVPAAGSKITKEDVEAFAASLKTAPATPADGKVAATPAARRIAGETGVPLASLQGSGPLGRIQAADVKPTTVQPAAGSTGERQAEIIPMVGMRLKIAQRLQASFQEAPHIAETVEADVSRLEIIKDHFNDIAQKRGEVKVSMTAILLKVIAWALERNPYINSSLIDSNIHLWKDVNIGVATAIDSGLIVPVVHNTNLLSISQIAARITDLSARARQGKLELSEVQRGTFTVSNLGMFGIKQFRAVINPPESAILAVGAVTRKPVVIDEDDTLAVRPIMNLTLSADHRVIDGVVAARFMGDLVEAIENPESLLY